MNNSKRNNLPHTSIEKGGGFLLQGGREIIDLS
jgi:hypothetical protein